MTRDRTPRSRFSPKQLKEPRSTSSGSESERPAWHVSSIDSRGRWGWQGLSSKDLWERIHPKLIDFESMTWAEIKRSGNSHSVDISQLCKEAQRRLIEIDQDDLDDLFSLRLSGTERLWGIRDGRVMRLLWWDPNHEVCPSVKRNT